MTKRWAHFLATYARVRCLWVVGKRVNLEILLLFVLVVAMFALVPCNFMHLVSVLPKILLGRKFCKAPRSGTDVLTLTATVPTFAMSS